MDNDSMRKILCTPSSDGRPALFGKVGTINVANVYVGSATVIEQSCKECGESNTIMYDKKKRDEEYVCKKCSKPLDLRVAKVLADGEYEIRT